MTLFKCLTNSIISTPGARCIMLDSKDFYLNTPMKCKEYMRLEITDIQDEIIKEYNLQELVTEDGYVYCAINKGMYGLLQAGSIAQELLKKRLSKHGYHQSKITLQIWTRETRPTAFTLVVYDFAMKIMSENDEDHIINALKKYYTITVDTDAAKYIGLTIEWDYENEKDHLPMPGYLAKVMIRFKHETPNKIQNSPHCHIKIQYGAKQQYVNDEDTLSPPLNKEETKYVQAVAGTLLYYARAVDSTILPALSSLATKQARLMQKTIEKVK
jgi:hypothetical protein